MAIEDDILRLDVHAAAGIVSPEQAYIEMAIVLDRRTQQRNSGWSQEEVRERWARRIAAVLEDELGARGADLTQQVESVKQRLPGELFTELQNLALVASTEEPQDPVKRSIEALRKLLRLRPRKPAKLWPHPMKCCGSVREICSYRSGPNGRYAALMDLDGRILTLTSDQPAEIAAGDVITVAGADRNRATLYQQGAGPLQIETLPFRRYFVIGALESALGLAGLILAVAFSVRSVQGGESWLDLWKYLLLAFFSIASLAVGGCTLIVTNVAFCVGFRLRKAKDLD
ncbi:hypothetical protein [Paludibaculum fermentans]|uniref:hypothetical protein n=1 Tax=Paludibaculum fermentans TaxID=1473598 RepID=UPI003EBEE92F